MELTGAVAAELARIVRAGAGGYDQSGEHYTNEWVWDGDVTDTLIIRDGVGRAAVLIDIDRESGHVTIRA